MTDLVPAFHDDREHEPIRLDGKTHRNGDVTVYDADYDAHPGAWVTSSVAVRREDLR